MKQLTLAKTDLQVSQLGFGTTIFSRSYPAADGLNLVAKFMESGGNFIDTAHCYCFWVDGEGGESERFVGKASREFGRDNLVIATKGGHIGMSGYPRPDAFLEPSLVRKDLDESLERLGMPSIDIYLLHRDDPRMTVEEIIESLNEHVAEGRTRYLGASNWSVDRYLAANNHAKKKGIQPFVMLQNQWSLAHPDWIDLKSPGAMRYIEDAELDALAANQIPVTAYSSTATGYFATSGEKGGQFESPQSRRRLAAVQSLAKERGATPNQIALAYLINQPFPVIPVLGSSNPEHLQDAFGATEIVLTSDEIQRLAAL